MVSKSFEVSKSMVSQFAIPHFRDTMWQLKFFCASITKINFDITNCGIQNRDFDITICGINGNDVL